MSNPNDLPDSWNNDIASNPWNVNRGGQANQPGNPQQQPYIPSQPNNFGNNNGWGASHQTMPQSNPWGMQPNSSPWGAQPLQPTGYSPNIQNNPWAPTNNTYKPSPGGYGGANNYGGQSYSNNNGWDM